MDDRKFLIDWNLVDDNNIETVKGKTFYAVEWYEGEQGKIPYFSDVESARRFAKEHGDLPVLKERVVIGESQYDEDDEDVLTFSLVFDGKCSEPPEHYNTAEARIAAGYDHAAEYECLECGAIFWDEFRSKYRMHEAVCPVCMTSDVLSIRFTGKIVNK